jgi:uncharacterized protein YfaS (alpha-2-macroglobulin family)
MKRTLLQTCALLSVICLSFGSSAVGAAPAKVAAPVKAVAITETSLEAEIDVQPPELAPASTIELRFPTAMIPPEQVGKVADVSPLIIDPALSGEFMWTSTRSGHYRLTQPPRFNGSYAFRLASGLKDLEGRGLATSQLDEVNSAPFRVIDQYPKWFDRSNARRKASFLFEFNDHVNPAEAAKAITFVCGETKVRIPSRVRHAIGKDFEDQEANAQMTWAEEVSGAKPAITPDGVRLSALIVEPESPLPVGNDWVLEVSGDLKNMSGHDKLAAGDAIALGHVLPFQVEAIGAHTPFDRDYFIRIVFNKPISGRNDEDEDPKKLEALAKKIASGVTFEPPVEITHADADWRSVAIHGKFALNQVYKVTVGQSVVSADGLELQAVSTAEKSFTPNAPYVSVPSFANAKLASGKGDFEFSAANVKQARVRARRMTGPQLLEAIEMYQPYENAFHNTSEKRAAFKPEPFDSYPGTVVYDRTFPIQKPLDRSELIKLTWSEILGQEKTGPLFFEIEGTATEGVEAKNVIVQSLVEFTDLGLMQKTNGRETLIFVVSLKTGQPIPGVRLTMVDGERKLLGSGETDAKGMAALQGDEPAAVIAEHGGDCTAIELKGSNSGVPLWNFDISTSWRSPWDPLRRTFLFSDRPVYRPGETAHLKAHTRSLIGDDLKLEGQSVKGRLVMRDPRYRIVLDKEVTFSAQGAFNDDLVLPEGPLGQYNVQLSFPDLAGNDDETDGNGYFSFRIDDYRPNTFEVKIETDKMERKAERMTIPLHATYFMGKPLSLAKVNWSAYRSDEFQPPGQYSAYHFGDAPGWAGYGLDRGTRQDEEGSASWDAYGDVTLSEEGKATLEMPVPPSDRAAMPQKIRIEAEVTDVNQQTITASSEFTVPGADFLLGLKGPESFGTLGKELSLEVIAITPDGKPYAGAAPVHVKIERQSYHTLKIATAGGGFTTKDQVVLQDELEKPVQLKASSASVSFKPTKSGTYFLTAESQDESGRKLLSRMPFYVIGGGEFPWALEDGVAISLQADKTELEPGDEATIVVKTPIAGLALVTVERNRIHHQFTAAISPENPTIKVPVGEGDAPNVFVSVIIVRGADASPKQHKMPEYRVGYCELTVGSTAKDLVVKVKADKEEVKPGETVSVEGTVFDSKGVAVKDGDVTLYAVDEGVLSLMSHKTPDPKTYFDEKFALAVKSWTNFDGLLSEDESDRQRGNKGFLVGGGGDDELPNVEIRKNFVATPLWLASATTDAGGKVAATFKAPDNLTRYRIMAVVAAGADRFGSAESSVKVNKPLMVEPVVPRFARLDDEVLVKAVVHNTTQFEGEVEVQLQLDDKAALISEERSFVPVKLGGAAARDQGLKHTLTLKAGATTSTIFPIKFTKLGTARWKWTARTVKWPAGAPALDDGTESVFEVNHPMPELREVKYVRLDAAAPIDNVLKDVSPQLLEGQGTVDVGVSSSRLSEVRDALGYVLHYPYGCVEQTSSATLPWLALGGFQELFPEHLAKEKSKAAVQAGVNRLLQMVTDDGGLAYWPGGDESNLWGSAYGGFTLLRARDAGATVPAETIDSLLAYLSKSLRNLEDEKDMYNLTHAAMCLYTLAKGGKAEPAYANLLYSKRDRLPEVAKLYLALSMLIAKAPEQQVKDLLGWKPKVVEVVKKAEPAKGSKSKKGAASPAKAKGKVKPVVKPTPPPAPVWTHWWGNQMNKALRLIAYTHLGLTSEADQLATSILQARNGRGEWGNTITNSWTLTALAAYERSSKVTSGPLAVRSVWNTQDTTLDLPTHTSTAKATYVLNAQLAAKPFALTVPAGRTAFARVEARAFSPVREFQGINAGYGITRTYTKLLTDGTEKPITDLRVGDMVLVNLEVAIGGGDRYIAINDPLPAVLEAVNPDFDTQGGKGGKRAERDSEPWFCDHREIRADRALFFTDYAPGKGKFSLSYLARVIAEGDTVAPPARIEAMYQPEKYGLSATQRMITLPSADGRKVAGK